MDENTTYYTTHQEALLSVLRGENDYVILRYSVGRRLTHSLGCEDEIRRMGPVLLENYTCIGVSKDKPWLLNKVNDAIRAMNKDGTLSMLKNKWLGTYVDTLSFGEYIVQNVRLFVYLGLALLAGALLVILLLSRKRAHDTQQELTHLAQTDALTGLCNKAATEAQIRQMLQGMVVSKEKHALFLLDIDNFKEVNDTLGHITGDTVLKATAHKLQGLFRATDVIGRIGGDEFFIFMCNYPDEEMVREKARQLLLLCSNTYSVNQKSCSISASIGIALAPRYGTDFNTLYRNADTALYLSKEHGKNTFTFYSGEQEHNYRSTRTKVDR